MKRQQAGYTLVEIMPAVAIIAIITAVGMPAYSGYVKRGRLTEAFTGLGAVKEATSVYEPLGDGWMHYVSGLGEDGSSFGFEYFASFDGKEQPLRGTPNVTVATRRIDAETDERVDRKEGKIWRTMIRKMAADGKSYTVTVQGGGKVLATLVFEKK